MTNCWQKVRPQPHHPISDVALVGGGTYSYPGETSPGHNSLRDQETMF
jgi:predicted ATPase with chaperone activity